jgi:hypothetical protein
MDDLILPNIRIAADVRWYEDKNDALIIYKQTDGRYYKIADPAGKQIFLHLFNSDGISCMNVVKTLQYNYANTDPDRIEHDAMRFLSYLQDKKIISE